MVDEEFVDVSEGANVVLIWDLSSWSVNSRIETVLLLTHLWVNSLFIIAYATCKLYSWFPSELYSFVSSNGSRTSLVEPSRQYIFYAPSISIYTFLVVSYIKPF
jgi:hypothetical protein